MNHTSPNLHLVNHPLVQHKLTLMRKKDASTNSFRHLLNELSMLMAYEVTRDMPTQDLEIETPLEKMKARVIDGKKLVFVSILRAGTGILLFETVPGLARQIGHHDLLSAIGPRPAMVVSGTQDKYSRDADQVVAQVAGGFITELRVERGHALDQERFDAMVEWIAGRV